MISQCGFLVDWSPPPPPNVGQKGPGMGGLAMLWKRAGTLGKGTRIPGATPRTLARRFGNLALVNAYGPSANPCLSWFAETMRATEPDGAGLSAVVCVLLKTMTDFFFGYTFVLILGPWVSRFPQSRASPNPC